MLYTWIFETVYGCVWLYMVVYERILGFKGVRMSDEQSYIRIYREQGIL